nr:hypothetical protein BaRGS_024216 [Batillaria attramentaria]
MTLSEIPDPIPGPAAKVTSCKQMTEEGVTNPEKCTTACQTTPSVKEAGVQTGPIIMTEKNETGTQTEDYLLSTPLRESPVVCNFRLEEFVC